MERIWTEYLPWLLKGASVSVQVTLASTAIALVLGLLVALMRVSTIKPLRSLGTIYVQFVRGTPLLLQLFYLFYVLPFVGIEMTPYVAGISGLALNYGAYMSEVYRAGILSIDRGQREAAMTLGMKPGRIMRRIILPQTARLVVPPLGNYFVGMFKDSALVSVLTLNELLFTAQTLAKNSYRPVVIFTLAAVLYFAISYPAARLVTWIEGRVQTDYGDRGPRGSRFTALRRKT